MKHELSDINPQKMDSQKWDMLSISWSIPKSIPKPRTDELLGDEEVMNSISSW